MVKIESQVTAINSRILSFVRTLHGTCIVNHVSVVMWWPIDGNVLYICTCVVIYSVYPYVSIKHVYLLENVHMKILWLGFLCKYCVVGGEITTYSFPQSLWRLFVEKIIYFQNLYNFQVSYKFCTTNQCTYRKTWHIHINTHT